MKASTAIGITTTILILAVLGTAVYFMLGGNLTQTETKTYRLPVEISYYNSGLIGVKQSVTSKMSGLTLKANGMKCGPSFTLKKNAEKTFEASKCGFGWTWAGLKEVQVCSNAFNKNYCLTKKFNLEEEVA